MAALVFLLLLLNASLVFFVRLAVQVKRTGDTGLRFRPGFSSAPGVAKGLMFLGAFLSFLAPIAYGFDLQGRYWSPTWPTVAAGLTLFAVGAVLTFTGQMQMGASWRIGVDDEEQTELIKSGLFLLVRNPIYTNNLIMLVGCWLLLPTFLGALGWLVTFIAFEAQVRRIEEPYLKRVHGERYTAYTRAVGRFWPYIGRTKGGE